MYQPKKIIKLGRDCEDFKFCIRERQISLPSVGGPRDYTVSDEAVPPKERGPVFEKVMDCELRETCAARVRFDIPKSVARYWKFGDCVGVKFTEEEIKLLEKGLAEIVV